MSTPIDNSWDLDVKECGNCRFWHESLVVGSGVCVTYIGDCGNHWVKKLLRGYSTMSTDMACKYYQRRRGGK